MKNLLAFVVLVSYLLVTASAARPAEPEKPRTFAPLVFEPQDWTTPKDAWLVNKSSEDKWNLWSTDKDAEKRWTNGVVLQGPIVKKDRNSPEEGAPVLHTRITGIPEGCYDVTLKSARALGVSLDGKTWRRYDGGALANNVHIADGAFEVWVDDRYASTPPGPCYYDQVILKPRPPVVDGVANPRFEFLDADGQPLGWTVGGRFQYDAGRKVFNLASPPRESVLVPARYDGISLTQVLKLRPGHYLLKAVARANTQECILFADSLDYRGVGDRCQVITGPFAVPIGISDELRPVELPFFVEDNNGAERDVTIGVRNQYTVPVHTEVDLREVTLTRLGDTELTYHWAEKLPMKPYHGLTTLRENAQWDRPGRVIFTDTYTGAEVWLMTQGERSYLRAQGVNSFSPDGRYLYVKDPGVILRSDGSARYQGFSRGYPCNEPWLAPWLRAYVPAGGDPNDWVLAGPPGPDQVTIRQIVTGQTVDVPLPKKEGWGLALLPGKINGFSLQSAAHDTFVWVSNDNRRIGLSNAKGERFRMFDVKSASPDPSKDLFMWREKVSWLRGFDGRWYAGYILNWAPFMGGYDQTPENTVNPGQMWALPIAEDDRRGILRVVDGFQYWGMCVHPYKLEDGSLLHWWTATHRAMNSEAGFRIRGTGYSTLALEDLATAQVRHFIASYPCLDHIDFSSQDFVIPESLLYPYTLLFIDVKRRAMWPISSLQFHDYGPYTASGGAGLQAQNPSPDVTKIACVSSLLCRADVATDGPVWKGLGIVGGKRPQTALDVYNVVVRYPQPPVNVRVEGNRIVWGKPAYHQEICGFNLYRSERSGVGFSRVNDRPIDALECVLPPGASGYYVLTSVEYSGLEGRMFSDEVGVKPGDTPFRLFYEAESAELSLPMAPVFDTPGCSNAYAVAVQDRDLLYKARLEKGLRGTGKLTVRVPAPGPCWVLARVRALKANRSGRIEFSIAGKPIGGVLVESREWRWLPLDGSPVTLEAGPATLEFASSALDVALDNILLTSDPSFTPAGKGNTPDTPPTAPTGLSAVKPADADDAVAPKTQPGEPPYVKLAWTPAAAPQGVHHYNVYRGVETGLAVGPATLLGSPSQPVFYDCGLATQTYYYRVTALDAWGNESSPSEVFAHQARPSLIRLKVNVKLPGIGNGDEVLLDASASSAGADRIKSFSWTFGDGTTSEGETVRHAYPRGGRYTAALRAETDSGDRAFQEIPIYVHDPRLQKLPADSVVLVEAENLAGEGGGKSQRLSDRMNASGDVRSYWEKDQGHWLEWDVPIKTPGTYTVWLKYSSGSKEVLRDLRIDGAYPAPASRRLVFPGTGGFSSETDNWSCATIQDDTGAPLRVPLTAGAHKLRMTNHGGGMAVDFILFVREP